MTTVREPRTAQPGVLSHSIWRPFTQMSGAAPAPRVVRGQGAHLFLEDGTRVVDMISSWWTNVHGHCHPRIAQAIYQQSCRLDHTIFAEFTHPPAERLTELLLEVLPPSLRHVFFSDNGSTAVEVALKMAFQYWWNKGTPRRSFIAFDGGYHGDTIGAMSLGSTSGFFMPFDELMFSITAAPFPQVSFERATGFTRSPDTKKGHKLTSLSANDSVHTDQNFVQKNDSSEQKNGGLTESEGRSLSFISKNLRDNPETYAAIVIEPLVQGAGGMRMCRPEFLGELASLAHSFNVPLIYDEVMTGFGRTGDWFACSRSDTAPDIICLSKGITGGFLPLAVTVSSDEIYNAFLSNDKQKTFYHGHSYTANPLACAAALASIELLKENEDSFRRLEERHLYFAEKSLCHESIVNFRACGTIAAMEIATDSANSYFNEVGPRLKREFLNRGFLIRPLGNTIYLMPPYCIDDDTLERAYDCINDAVRQIFSQLQNNH